VWQRGINHGRDALRPGSTARDHPVARWQAEQSVAISLARLHPPVREPAPLPGDEIVSLVQSAQLAAVQGTAEDAIAKLKQALSLGAGDVQHLRDDPNFATLRGRPDFRALLAPFAPAS